MKFNLFSKIYSKINIKLDFGRITQDAVLNQWNGFSNNNSAELLDEPETISGGYGWTAQSPGINTQMEDEVATGINQLNYTVVASDKGQAAPYADVITQVEQAQDEDLTQMAVLSRVPVLDHVRASERNPVYRAILTLVGESPDSLDPLIFMLGFLVAQWQTLQKLGTMSLRRVGEADETLDLTRPNFSFRQMIQAIHMNSIPIVQTCLKHQHNILASFIRINNADHYLFQDAEHYYYISWIRYDLIPFLIARPETANAMREVRAQGSYILTNITGLPLADLEHLYSMLLAIHNDLPDHGFDGLHVSAIDPPRVVPLIQAAGDFVHGQNRLWNIGFVDMMHGRLRDFMYRHGKLNDFELAVNMGFLATQRLLPKTHEESQLIPALRIQLRRINFVAPAVANRYVSAGMGVDASKLFEPENVAKFITAPSAYAKIIEAAEVNATIDHAGHSTDRVVWRGIISAAAKSCRIYGFGTNPEEDDVWECAGTTDFKYAYNLSRRRYDMRLGPKAVRNNATNLPRVKGWEGFWNTQVCIYPAGLARNVNYDVVNLVQINRDVNVGLWRLAPLLDRNRIVEEHNAELGRALGPEDAPLDDDDAEDEPEPDVVRVNGNVIENGPPGIVWTGNENYAEYYVREDEIAQVPVLHFANQPVVTWAATSYIIDKTIHCRPANEVICAPMSIQEYVTVEINKSKKYFIIDQGDQRSNLPLANFLRFSGYGSRDDRGNQLYFRTKKSLVTICTANYEDGRHFYNVRNNAETQWEDEPLYGGNMAFDHYMLQDARNSKMIYELNITRLNTVYNKMHAMAHANEEEFGPAPYDFDDDDGGVERMTIKTSDFASVEDSQTHTTGDAVVNETAPDNNNNGEVAAGGEQNN